MAIDYNRFLYARGNPLKYSDPTGYIPADLPEEPPGTPPGADPWVVDFYWKNRWYNARGFARRADGHWDKPIPPRYEDKQILYGVMREDFIGWLVREMRGNLEDDRLADIARRNAIGGGNLPFVSQSEKLLAYAAWALLTGPGREWDFKPPIIEAVTKWQYYEGKYYFHDIWANINYGYTGLAAGFTERDLLVTAAMGQAISGTSRFEYGLNNLYDDPSDKTAIRIGVALYKARGLNINEASFREAFLQGASKLTFAKEPHLIP